MKINYENLKMHFNKNMKKQKEPKWKHIELMKNLKHLKNKNKSN